MFGPTLVNKISLTLVVSVTIWSDHLVVPVIRQTQAITGMDSDVSTKDVVFIGENHKLKSVTPSVIRRGLCMVRQESEKTLSKKKTQLIQRSRGIVECAGKIAETAVKYGIEVATSGDPLAAAIEVGGKSGVGVALSRFSASQCAGIIGVIVSSITPHVRTAIS